MRTPKHLQDPHYKRKYLGQPATTHPHHPPATERTVFLEDKASVWAWPSRGGLVVLEHATALDFEFLGLDAVHPPMRRDPAQDAEDRLCQRLLLLGAKWFDSRERYGFVANVAAGEEPEIQAIEAVEEPAPTTMRGAMFGMQEKHNLVPPGASNVLLAKTMDEKCEILRGMGAKFYASLDQYDGAACFNAWKEKTRGEFGPLFQTSYQEE